MKIAAAPLTALLFWLAFPGGGGLWPLLFVAQVPFLLVIAGEVTLRQAGIFGLLTGLFHFSALLYWIVTVLGYYGGLPLYLSVPAFVLLALYMSVYLGIFAMVSRLLISRLPLLFALWLVPAAWVALDWCRSFLFSGFPWMDPGYGLAKVPWLLQSADLWGHYGLSYVLVLVNTLAALFLAPSGVAGAQKRERLTLIVPVILLCVGVALYSMVRWQQIERQVRMGAAMRVGVVQGNIAQDQKWSPGLQEKTMANYIGQSKGLIERRRPDLLIWPETALPFYPPGHPLLYSVRDLAGQGDVALLTGAPWVEQRHKDAKKRMERVPEERDSQGWSGVEQGKGDSKGAADERDTQERQYFNSALLFDTQGRIAAGYSKSHLVPFGEYVPLKKMLPFLAPVVEAVGDFSPGVISHTLDCQNARIGVLICFESIFPEIARKWVGVNANLLVNLTNDAWYGRSSAPHHSLAMTMLRAVETRRFVVRAANTGFSGVIDPLGRVRMVSPLFEPWAEVDEVVLMEEKSAFVRWGYLFSPLCLGAVIISLAWIILRNPRPRRLS